MFKEGKANHIVNLNTMDCNGFKEGVSWGVISTP